MYFRKSCVTCQRAKAYLGDTAVAETVNAVKVRYGGADALALLAGIDTVVAARGKKLTEFDLTHDRPDDATLLAHLIGPTGNLRAPTARVGRTLVVGFSEDAYRRVLGPA